MKFCVLTLGCKVNQYEGQAIENILIARGHIRAQAGGGCHACIINTCAVTAESVRKSRQAVRRMKTLEPGALIAVCGCFSQLEPSAIEQIGADLIGGSGDRQAFALEIEQLVNSESGIWNSEFSPYFYGTGAYEELHNSEFQIPNSEFEDLPPGGVSERTRALLKIQDGCDNFCAYCVIPYARGRARSLPPERAAAHAALLEAQGFREIVITGIEISSYGKDLIVFQGDGSLVFSQEDKRTVPLSPAPLIDVIQKISIAAPKTRLRLGSLDPGTVTEGFCREMSMISNLCPHFHLSLQSGCDETLRRMGRKYGARDVLETIAALRRMFPDCGITADLITGFPGETDAEFAQTLEFIKTAVYSGMHIFPFSPRPGTRAADMPGQIKKSIRLERAKIASAVAADMAQAFKISQVGKTVEVLFERERGGYRLGHSGNYLEVAVKTGGAKNSLHTVRITGVNESGMVFGSLVSREPYP